VIRYLIGRIAQGVIVVAGAVAISFVLASLAGNPVDAIGTANLSPAARQALAHQYGFDLPFLQRFVRYFGDVLHGDFGHSFRSQQPATHLVLQALPYTLELVFAAMALACVVAVPVAVFSVLRRESRADRAIRRLLIVAQGLPEFWLALLLVLLFAVELAWLPSVGADTASSLVLPTLALSIPLFSTIVRLLRSQLLDIMGMEFILALRAKGLSDREIVLGHALRNAIAPVISFLGLQVGWLLGGTILVEVVFGWPGIGNLAVTATGNRDLAVIQTVVVFTAIGYVLFNLIADLLVLAIDPRVRATA
jgi:ABC-type dipeptide/oligopeptide/nickel transport system permease component